MVFPSTVHFTILNAAAKLYYKPAGICKLYGGQNLGIGMILTGEKAVTSATKAEEPKDGAPAETEAKEGPSILPAISGFVLGKDSKKQLIMTIFAPALSIN